MSQISRRLQMTSAAISKLKMNLSHRNASKFIVLKRITSDAYMILANIAIKLYSWLFKVRKADLSQLSRSSSLNAKTKELLKSVYIKVCQSYCKNKSYIIFMDAGAPKSDSPIVFRQNHSPTFYSNTVITDIHIVCFFKYLEFAHTFFVFTRATLC